MHGTKEDPGFSKRTCIRLRDDIDAQMEEILKLKAHILEIIDPQT